MKVRIVSPGWEKFTGSLGFRAVFKDGESVDDLDRRAIARIGATLQIVNADTGEQVGPAATAAAMRFEDAPVAAPLIEQKTVEKQEADARERLAAEAEARKAAEAKALEEAKAKAEADAASVVYSRQELEAIGANDGIEGLRLIAKPLGVKGRGIAELVTEILAAQAKKAAE